MTHRLILPESVQLAAASPFRIGQVDVDPPTRRLWHGDREQILEPRVMQVLVALASARGAVVSREELIARCWDGRIVGENAIHRVISRLRQIEHDIAEGSFRLETIPRVGYRLIERAAEEACAPDGAPTPPKPVTSARLTRRNAFAGGAVIVGAGAIAYFAITPRVGHRPPSQAEELYRRGVTAQRMGTPETAQQAVAYFKQAVEADPRYAAAWGALALSYRHLLEGFGGAERASLPGLLESAARHALALDPDNADALLARTTAPAFFRHWGAMEPQLRSLVQRFPDHWLAHAQLGLLLQDVGRIEEGLGRLRRAIEIDSYLPVANAYLARGLSCAGRPEEAEEVLEQARRRWPTHLMLWQMRYNFLLYSGRPEAAAAHLLDPDLRPPMVTHEDVDALLTIAQAVETRAAAKLADAVRIATGALDRNIAFGSQYGPVLMVLGRPDLAFAAMDRYYFGDPTRRPAIAAPGPFDRRLGLVLFSPAFFDHRDDPRRLALLRRTGIADYWRGSGTHADARWATPAA